MLRSKTYPFPVVAVLSLAVQAGFAAPQDLTTGEVVEKCITALGGRANWQAIETLELSGTHSSFSQIRPFLMRRKRPNLYRFDHNEGRREITIAYDGKTAWWRTEITINSRANWPVEPPISYAQAIIADADLAIGILNVREGGNQAELVGEVEVDLEPYLLLNVLRPDGAIEHWYLDIDTYLPDMRIFESVYLRRSGWEQRTYFSNYREISGILLPHHIEVELGNDHRVLDIHEVRVNVELDTRIFSLPLPAGMEKLRTLAGRWNVSIQSRERPSASWSENEASSRINADFHGGLLEEEISYTAENFNWKVKRLFSYDRFRDVFRITCFDNFTSHLRVLEGEIENGRLVVSDVPTDTGWHVYNHAFHTREIVYDIRENSFHRIREISTDDGNTWFADRRFIYRRAQETQQAETQ